MSDESDDALRKKLDLLVLEYVSHDPLVRRLKALLHERDMADMVLRSMLAEEHVEHIPPQPPDLIGFLQITTPSTATPRDWIELPPMPPPPRSRHERRADAALRRRQKR